jgi:integrase
MKTWHATAVQGLYQHGPTSKFYARFRLSGKRHFQNLKTTVWSIAKLRHAELIGQVEARRQSEASPEGDPRNLGELAKIYLKRLETSTQKPGTKVGYRATLVRLRRIWPGNFDTALPRNVTRQVLVQLRTRLQASTGLMPNRKAKPFRPSSVNSTLLRLRDLLSIAREHQLISSDPFQTKAVLQERIWLPAGTRRPVLPNRADMDRIFDEMTRVPNPEGYNAGLLEFLQLRARDQSEHARFLAYTGARLSEANGTTFEDYQDTKIHLRGTKSRSANRVIPTTAPLRALVAAIREREPFRKGRILNATSSLEAIKRACGRLKLPLLTHHDLRHYFATICVESGVDFLTISGWLGQSDGGVLLMKTYGHLRDEHSLKSMERVSFGPLPQSNAG